MPHTQKDLGLAALQRELRAGLGNRLNPQELAALRAAAVAEMNRERPRAPKADMYLLMTQAQRQCAPHQGLVNAGSPGLSTKLGAGC